MESFNILNILKDDAVLNRNQYDCLRYELDKQFHYYGDHFNNPFERERKLKFYLLRGQLKFLLSLIRVIKGRKLVNGDLILSNAYFTLNDELEKLGYEVFYPPWQVLKNRKILANKDIFIRCEKVKNRLRNLDFNRLIEEKFLSEIGEFEAKMTTYFKEENVKSLFVPNDVSFFENLSISICRQIGIPSFIFLHGLPGRYNNIDENRSDYLIVWGEKIKETYIKKGMDPKKIFVSGHPYYKNLNKSSLKFSLENILILTKSLNGAHHSDGVILGDRSNLILYLYSIEKILKRFGVKSVRFRPHPSENENWYIKFINNDFYKLDNGNITESIQKSTLVIGPTSTVFLESLYTGINYVVYEPSVKNIDIVNFPLVPPFDGEDLKVPVAKDETGLEYILKNKVMVDPSCFNDYITTPFDVSFVKTLI